MSSATRIAIASCATLPSYEHDDVPLLAALRERGAVVEQLAWDDPSVDWASFSAVLIRTTWDYQDRPQAFLAWAEQVGASVPLFNPAPLIRWNLHKSYLRELERHGAPLPTTAWLDAGGTHDLPALVREHGIAHGFLKPMVGANSRHTLRFDARVPAELAHAHAELARLTLTHDMMLQPYLRSVEHEGEGELSAIYFDGVFSHAVRKRPVVGDYRVQDTWGAVDEPTTLDAAQLEVCERTFAALARVVAERGWAISLPLLYARVDLLREELRDGQGRWVLNELEIVEPSLFFRHGPTGPAMLADALLRRLDS